MGRRAFLGLTGLGATGLALAACGPSAPSPVAGSTTAGATTPPSSVTPSPTVTTPPAPTGRPVHLRLYEGDGSTYGCAMPIIAYLTEQITDCGPLNRATTVTAGGVPVTGAWYFEHSAIYPDTPIEGHWRPNGWWPAHAQIHMDLPIKGISAGPGWVFDDSLTLDFSTGPLNIAAVDGQAERMSVVSDGNPVFMFPVSLGKATTPTFNGWKVVMEKDAVQRMVGGTGASAYDVQVPWSVRVTNSGEFIHAASWNGNNIGSRSTSHGCTNLNVNDAKNYFNFCQVGDPVNYRNTGGPDMPTWDGYGDWNITWDTWSAGGIVPVKS
jgi:lipoprotein-anchoring transpeptidase ErfK/SrfK